MWSSVGLSGGGTILRSEAASVHFTGAWERSGSNGRYKNDTSVELRMMEPNHIVNFLR